MYLQDQLSKNTVDVLDDVLKHFEKQTQQNVTHPNNRQKGEYIPVNIISDIQQRDTNRY